MDNNNILSTYPNSKRKLIHRDIDNKLSLCTKYIITTGVILNDTKTHVYAWRWTWKNSKFNPLYIKLEQNYPLKGTPFKFLGIWTNQDGNNNYQIQLLLVKAHDFSKIITTSSLTMNNICTWYSTTWLPIIWYTLPHSCFIPYN